MHVEKALDVIRFGREHGGKIEPVQIHEAGAEKTYFASCRYFETARWEFSEPVSAATSQGSCDLLIFLDGSGTIRWNGERASYGPAQVWMVPAGLGAYEIVPGAPSSLLRTYVPREPGEFGPALSGKGVKEADWLRLVHK